MATHKTASQIQPTEFPVPGYSRVAELAEALRLSKATIWRLSKKGTFPKPLKLTENCTCWNNSDINAWLRSKEIA